jgi:TPR repeat protein
VWPETYPLVARRYDEGNGLPKDPEQAVRWYRKAAEAGDAPSMTRLAAALAKGRGVKKDEAQATMWYSEATKKQEPEAEYQVGMLLIKGKGGYAQDEKTGLEWLRRAASHGHVAAREELARRGG